MGKFRKILLTALVLLVCILLATTNVAAWTKDCDTIEQQIQEVLDEINSSTGACELWLTYGNSSYMQECLTLRNQYNEMQEWAEEYCNEPCETNLRIEYLSFQYKVDNTDLYVYRISYQSTGATLFCIEPDKYVNECTDYTDTSITLSTEAYKKIALAIDLYKDSATTNHYIATQLYIWKVMGYNYTVNGQGIDYYWSGFETKAEEEYTSVVVGGESSANTV